MSIQVTTSSDGGSYVFINRTGEPVVLTVKAIANNIVAQHHVSHLQRQPLPKGTHIVVRRANARWWRPGRLWAEMDLV